MKQLKPLSWKIKDLHGAVHPSISRSRSGSSPVTLEIWEAGQPYLRRSSFAMRYCLSIGRALNFRQWNFSLQSQSRELAISLSR